MAKKVNDLKMVELNEKDMQEVVKKIDKYVDDKKEDLGKEIDLLIDEKIELKVTKMMKDEEKRYTRTQRFRIFRRDIMIVLLLLVVSYFGYCLYKVDYFSLRHIDESSKLQTKNDDKIDDKSDVKLEKPIEDKKYNKDYYVKEYGYLVENLIFDDSDLRNFLQNNMNSKDISNELKLKIAYHNLDKEKLVEEDEMIRFKAQDLQDALKKVLGDKSDLKNEKFNFNGWKFVFYEDMYLGFKEDLRDVKGLFAVKDAKEKDEKLIFEVVVALSSEKKLYDLDGKIILDSYKNDNLLDYEDKLEILQISFQKEKDNYIFESLKILD